MKKTIGILLLFIVSAIPGTITFAGSFEETLTTALVALEVKKGESNLLLLSDAPYVLVDGTFALPYLDIVQERTGCTAGKGNLLFFQRPQSHALRFLLMRKTDGETVIISREGTDWVSDRMNLSPASIASPSFWEEAKKFKAGKDMGAMAAIAAVWAQGGPYDFLKSAELHNHICPGLTSGYLIAHYIKNHYPLKDGEKYVIVASPVWCKEDALQVILDCTPGKHGMIVKHLSKEQVARISFANPAGMVLVWNNKTKSGKGYALSFDFDTLKALSPKDSPKAAMVLAAIDHLQEPDRFVTTAAEFELNEKLFDDIMQAGNNPYQLAGLLKK